jgi:hypothetical protein
LTSDELKQRIDAVEEGYEYFLAYAARGVSGDGADGEVRAYLRRTDEALGELAGGFTAVVESRQLAPAEPYHAMIKILERDAQDTQAAVRLVMAQPAISSQLIDNLNASIHFRALLTDVFLIDEIVKTHVTA